MRESDRLNPPKSPFNKGGLARVSAPEFGGVGGVSYTLDTLGTFFTECIHEAWRYLKASIRRGIAAIDSRTSKK